MKSKHSVRVYEGVQGCVWPKNCQNPMRLRGMDWASRNRRVRAHFHGVAAVAETTQWTGVERRWDTSTARACRGVK